MWKCSECGSHNHDDILRCVCGNEDVYEEIDEEYVETESTARMNRLDAIAYLIAIVGICSIASAFGRGVVEYWVSENHKKKQDAAMLNGLNSARSKVLEKLPIMVDEITELVDVNVGPGLRVTYDYYLHQLTSDEIDFDRIITNLKLNVCSNEEMIPAIRYGVEYHFVYVDMDVNYVGETTVDYKTCGLTL